MSSLSNKKLEALAAILKDRGLKEESSKVLSVLSSQLLLKESSPPASEGPKPNLSPPKRLGRMTSERLDELQAEHEAKSLEEKGELIGPPTSIERRPVGPSGEPPSDTNLLSRPEEQNTAPENSDKKTQQYGPPSSVKDPRKKNSDSDEDELTLKVGSKNRGEVRRLQRALEEAGFELEEYGVDGLFGKETKAAVIAFKEKAASDGRYSGKVDGIVSKDTLDLIEAYPAKSSEKDNKPSLQSGTDLKSAKDGPVLYIGDSQMVGSIGRALMGAGGPGKKLAKSGTQASYWAKNPKLIKELKKGPAKIIISLNGNGTRGTASLIETILKHTDSGTKVIWSGAPPPIKRAKGSTWAKYLTSNKGFQRAYQRRSDFNTQDVAPLMPDGWVFIDPYKHIKYDAPRIIDGTEYPSGYTCSKCDGIHVPSHVASAYVSNIQSLLA